MARYYRRRYTRVVRPKKKWASNVIRFNKTEAFQGNQAIVQTLVTNSTQSSNPTPVIVKAGNFKVQGDAGITVSNVATATTVGISLYVLYIPEGLTITSYLQVTGIINSHPEWIMAWKYVSSNVLTTAGADNNQSFSFSSRLKRNLNSGDSIILAAIATTGVSGNFYVSGMAQWWTCAN